MLGRNVLGWFEAVALPDLGVERAYAKIDTGADHSVLHARDPVVHHEAGRSFVEFSPPLLRVQRDSLDFDSSSARRVRATLVDERIVRSSTGHEERRFQVEVELLLGARSLLARFTLTDRSGMRFPILLGRSTLTDGGFLVDPTRAECLGPPLPGRAARSVESNPRDAGSPAEDGG